MSESNTQADEYVLGLLDPAETAAFEAAMGSDPGLRAAVRAARERFLELDLTAEAAAPRSGMWGSIAGQLDGRAPSTEADNVVALQVRQPVKPARANGFWTGFGAASLAAGLVGAIVLAPVLQRSVPAAPSLVVVLLDAQSKPGAIIEAYAGDKVRVVPLEAFAVPEGRVIQVWTLPDATTGPVSLGLLPQVHSAMLAGPALPPPKPDQLYEFTLEPAGGSPTGRPTGPILAKGFAKQPI